MQSSPAPPLADEASNISAKWPICTGYLENTLAVFHKHDHPFILVSTLAMTWSGANNMGQREIDVLMRSSKAEAIITDLIALGEWKHSTNYAVKSDPSMVNQTSIPDIWLETCIEDPWYQYLRFWPEELYKLSIDCKKAEVLDVQNDYYVLVEEEYHRAPFSPSTISMRSRYPFPPLQYRAKLMRMDLPIFIPTIEDHLNALLDQWRGEIETGLHTGNIPEWQLKNFIRYLFLDWAPNREWILEKVQERNRELMNLRIDKFGRKLLILFDPVSRKPVFNKMPWELNYPKELLVPKKKDSCNDKVEDRDLQKVTPECFLAGISSDKRKSRHRSSRVKGMTVSDLGLYCGKRHKWQKPLRKSILMNRNKGFNRAIHHNGHTSQLKDNKYI